MARLKAREAAMQLVFEQLFGGDATAQTLVDLIDYNPNEKDSAYIDTVVGGVKEHADELDSEISACLRGWTLARLSRVDLAIMRLAVFEMQYTGLPAAVAINEAVELTRKYSGEERKGYSELVQTTTQFYEGIPTIRLFGKEDFFA